MCYFLTLVELALKRKQTPRRASSGHQLTHPLITQVSRRIFKKRNSKFLTPSPSSKIVHIIPY